MEMEMLMERGTLKQSGMESGMVKQEVMMKVIVIVMPMPMRILMC